MCLYTDIQQLENIDQKSIITYLENLYGFAVVPSERMKEIEGVLERSRKLAYDKGKIKLQQDIQKLIGNE